MQISCNTIYDLLPLYVKGLCSEESRIIVDEHSEKCSFCKKKLEIMRGDNNLNKITEESLTLKTKFNSLKLSLFCVVFYIFFIIALMIAQYCKAKAYKTYNVGYGYASIIIIMLVFIILGIIVTYLGKQQKIKLRINIIEFLVIGSPFVFMCFFYFYSFFNLNGFGVNINEFININAKELFIAGSVLFGCDIFILITYFKNKKQDN